MIPSSMRSTTPLGQLWAIDTCNSLVSSFRVSTINGNPFAIDEQGDFVYLINFDVTDEYIGKFDPVQDSFEIFKVTRNNRLQYLRPVINNSGNM